VKDSIDLVKNAFEHRATDRLPKGELWLCTEVFKVAGLQDNLNGHLKIRENLGMDLLILPVSTQRDFNTDQGYRYFGLEDVKKASRNHDFFFGVLIDGPFQRLAAQKGLMQLLKSWVRDGQEIFNAYRNAAEDVDVLIKQCLEMEVGAVILADDIAGETNTYFHPREIERFFMPFYTKAVSSIHSSGAYAFLHSCGNITGIVTFLVSCGLDGLAALQAGANNLKGLKKEYGSRLTIMSGIDADLFLGNDLDDSVKAGYLDLIWGLSESGGFILCSSCGLYSGRFFNRLQELYLLADRT